VSASAVVWRELRPLSAELFRCDLCGDPADTLHLWPWCDRRCEAVLFACPRHDAGGYWLRLDEFLDERDEWTRHLADKVDPRDPEPGGLGLLLRRLDELEHPAVVG
jgi:hypothetical protein